jgi:transcriptional regulator with XRE-family HTH domain
MRTTTAKKRQALKPRPVRTYHDLLYNARSKSGLTVSYIVEAAQISVRTLYTIETGETDSQLSTIAALAEIYGLSLDQIVKLPGKNWEPAQEGK